MAFCGKCGAKVEDGVKFCPSCGAQMSATEEKSKQDDLTEKLQELNNTADTTSDFSSADIEKNKVMAILSYFGILVLIPLLAAKDSKFARYHVNQGLVLAICEIVYNVLAGILKAVILTISPLLTIVTTLIDLVGLVFLVLAIIGIVNAANGRAKELPVIGTVKLLK